MATARPNTSRANKQDQRGNEQEEGGGGKERQVKDGKGAVLVKLKNARGNIPRPRKGGRFIRMHSNGLTAAQIQETVGLKTKQTDEVGETEAEEEVEEE